MGVRRGVLIEMVERSAYSSILLKLSGEMLAGERGWGYSSQSLFSIVDVIARLWKRGIRIGIVVGGGNFWRGRMRGEIGISRVVADEVGMLATVMNSLVLYDKLVQLGVKTRVVGAMDFGKFAPALAPEKAAQLFREGEVLIFAGGTSNPFFTTDTAAVLRAAEVGAEVILKGTKVDGVYDKDPVKHPDAKRYSSISVEEVLEKKLGIIDMTAASLLRDVGLKMVVFNIGLPENLVKIISGEDVGTLIY